VDQAFGAKMSHPFWRQNCGSSSIATDPQVERLRDCQNKEVPRMGMFRQANSLVVNGYGSIDVSG
jgi:hypothetical protein